MQHWKILALADFIVSTPKGTASVQEVLREYASCTEFGVASAKMLYAEAKKATTVVSFDLEATTSESKDNLVYKAIIAALEEIEVEPLE